MSRLTVEPGQFCAIVGPTGCGKSTTLAQVSGLEQPSAGSVSVGGRIVDGITDGRQLHVPGGRALPLEDRARQRADRARSCSARPSARPPCSPWTGCAASAWPASRTATRTSCPGGMRKRVAMAAALINNPRILLMDEPFGALDVQTKAIMQNELLQLWEELRPSVLFITHDLDEAVALVRQGGHHDQQPRHGQGRLRHRPAPAARRRPADPPRGALPGTAGPDLGIPEGRGHPGLRARRQVQQHDNACQTDHRRPHSEQQQQRTRIRPARARRRTTWIWIGRARPRRRRHRRLAVVHGRRLGGQVLLRPAVRDLEQPGPALHRGHRLRHHLGEPLGHGAGGLLRASCSARSSASSSASCWARTSTSPPWSARTSGS